MSLVKICAILVIALAKESYGEQGVCAPPKQTGVISFIQEVFFDNEPSDFAVGSHPSGILAVVSSSSGLTKPQGLQTTRIVYDGVLGYIHKINGKFYYFPSFGCDVKPFLLNDCNDPIPNLPQCTSGYLLKIAIQLYKKFPYCLPCSSFSFRQASGLIPTPAGQIPGANTVFEFSNVQAAYITTFNGSGYEYAKAAQEFAASRGFSIDVTYDKENTILSEKKCPQPPQCKRTPNNLLDLSNKCIPEITNLQPGSACYWASLVAEFLSSNKDTCSQLVYVYYGLNKRGCGGFYFGEGYIPASTWNNLYDPILNTFCS